MMDYASKTLCIHFSRVTPTSTARHSPRARSDQISQQRSTRTSEVGGTLQARHGSKQTRTGGGVTRAA
eukprot:contig_7676_g1803